MNKQTEIVFDEGSTIVWTAVPKSSDGNPIDLSGATAQLRIVTSPESCLPILASAIEGGGFAFRLDADTLPLVPGRYAFALWIEWADGQRRPYVRGLLKVRKGC